MSNSIRVRFAPSPTGYLHVGGARTALYNFLFAKKNGGTMVLRVEDTDQERSTEESMKMQLQDLEWLGLSGEEGPDLSSGEERGEFGPYRQSRRAEIYHQHIQELLERGKAYHCFHTSEEIEAANLPKGQHFVSEYRDTSLEQAKAWLQEGRSAVVRFRNDQQKSYAFDDLIRGSVEFPSDMVGDFVLTRSTGMPVYNFCCVIDDHLMKISHVFRAEEHLSNSLRQLMIYEAFGWQVPRFGHMSLILGSDKQKLSKRHGATSCHEYRLKGFLPQALNNFIALLGWSPGEDREIMSLNEMVDLFSTERMVKSGAVFDETKLRWMNAQHLRALPAEELWQAIQPFLEEAGLSLPDDSSWQRQALEVFREKMEVLTDAVDLLRPFDQSDFRVSEGAREVLHWDTTRSVIEKWLSLLQPLSQSPTEEEFADLQKTVKNDCGVKGKTLFMPLRVAVIGQPHGAETQKIVPLMEVGQLRARAEKCLQEIDTPS